MNDYRRPAAYQVYRHYKCTKCGYEQRVESCYSAAMPCPMCGGWVEQCGESYPADPSEWHEVRDNVNDQFRNEYDR